MNAPYATNLLEQKLEKFNKKQLDIILQNTFSLQLTEGCSNVCGDCGAGALPGIRSYIPFKNIESLFEKYSSKFKNMLVLYFASDPFDYNFEGVSYRDVHKFVAKKTHRVPYVSTSAPKGSEKEVLEVVVKNNSFKHNDDWTERPFIDVLSVMKSNYPRLEKYFLEMDGYKQKDQIVFENVKVSDDYSEVIKDESIKKIVGDSSIYVCGKNNGSKLFVVPTENDFVGSFDDPVTFKDIILYKKYRYKHSENNIYTCTNFNIDIRDFYSKDLPKGQLHSYRLGEKFKDDLSDKSIACFHGVVLTPNGVYNYQAVKPTPDEPIGWKKSEITPNNFSVIPFIDINNEFGDKRNFFLKLGNRRLKAESFLSDLINKNKFLFLTTNLLKNNFIV